MKTYGLLVVGSGPAGVHAAAAYVEAGGPGTVGLLSADVDPPYQRPPLSKDVLAGEAPAEVVPILDDDAPLRRVDVRLGTTVSVLDTGGRRVRTVGGDVLTYERLVLATGSDPVALPGVEEGAAVHVLRSLQHGRRLAEAVAQASSVVVVGSGFIGCEAAAAIAGRGVRTTLVTPEPAPQAARLGEWAGDQIASWLTDAGVDLRTGRTVERVEAPATVHLDDGSQVEADLVLAAVGVSQARDFLAASALDVREDHLVVDDTLRSSDPRVWAAGDVARGRHAVARREITVEHWGDAMAMGTLAGHNAAADAAGAQPGRWDDAPGFWSEIGEHTLKYSAWGDGHAEERVVEHGDGAFTVWYADSAGELVGVLTHEADDDYERGGDLLAKRASLEDALGSGS